LQFLIVLVCIWYFIKPQDLHAGGLTHLGPWNHILDGVQIPMKGALLRATCTVLMHKCIAHCSPAATGECVCPAHAPDESIRRREGWQDGDAAFCQITLDTCFSLYLYCMCFMLFIGLLSGVIN